MNKTIVIFVLASILLIGIGLISAEQNKSNEHGLDSAVRIQSGDTYTTTEGKNIQFEHKDNRLKLRAENSEANTGLNITSDGLKLMAQLSNGKNAEIKVMPNTASETALERLRLKICTEERNCTIELKEVGQGNETRLAYELQAERHARILGLFQTKMQVRAQVDAENGEIIKIGKPWWAFLATEPEETD